MSGKTWLCLVMAGVMLTVGSAVAGEFTFTPDTEDKRPAIWKNADSQDALKAETAARLDAWAKLAEFIGGMEVKGATSVRNLVDVDQAITGNMRARLSRMSTERIVHYPNGLVQVEVAAKLTDLVETVESYLRENVVDGAVASSESFRSTNLEDEDAVIAMWGNSALKGTEGEGVVKAVRAAELAAMEQMVAMMEGVQLGRETVVRDLVLASDRIKSCIDDAIKGMQYETYRIMSGIVEVDARVRLVSTIRRVERVYEEVKTLDLCTGCPVVDLREVEIVCERLEKTDHRVTGKAAIKDYAEPEFTRTSGKKGKNSETVYEKVGPDGGRIVRRETVEETVVRSGIAID